MLSHTRDRSHDRGAGVCTVSACNMSVQARATRIGMGESRWLHRDQESVLVCSVLSRFEAICRVQRCSGVAPAGDFA